MVGTWSIHLEVSTAAGGFLHDMALYPSRTMKNDENVSSVLLKAGHGKISRESQIYHLKQEKNHIIILYRISRIYYPNGNRSIGEKSTVAFGCFVGRHGAQCCTLRWVGRLRGVMTWILGISVESESCWIPSLTMGYTTDINWFKNVYPRMGYTKKNCKVKMMICVSICCK